MRTNVLLGFALLILLGCKETNSAKSTCLKPLVDSLKVETTNNILIYTINPNDCLSCIHGFKTLNQGLAESKNSKLYVISVDRAIEKEVILKSNPDLNLLPAFNKSVCWSKELFVKINGCANYNRSLSLITIYDYEADSILFCKPIREIRSEDEVKRLLIKG